MKKHVLSHRLNEIIANAAQDYRTHETTLAITVALPKRTERDDSEGLNDLKKWRGRIHAALQYHIPDATGAWVISNFGKDEKGRPQPIWFHEHLSVSTNQTNVDIPELTAALTAVLSPRMQTRTDGKPVIKIEKCYSSGWTKNYLKKNALGLIGLDRRRRRNDRFRLFGTFGKCQNAEHYKQAENPVENQQVLKLSFLENADSSYSTNDPHGPKVSALYIDIETEKEETIEADQVVDDEKGESMPDTDFEYSELGLGDPVPDWLKPQPIAAELQEAEKEKPEEASEQARDRSCNVMSRPLCDVTLHVDRDATSDSAAGLADPFKPFFFPWPRGPGPPPDGTKLSRPDQTGRFHARSVRSQRIGLPVFSDCL